jgi:hypothetical protein
MDPNNFNLKKVTFVLELQPNHFVFFFYIGVSILTDFVVTLHQQQSDNFCKIHKEIAKWTLAVSYV